MFSTRFIAGAFAAISLFFSARSGAVIIYGDNPDPAANRVAPGSVFPHDGWDYEGQFGGFLGTPIAPQFFISAKHIGGGTGSVLVFNGASYTAVRSFPDPASDLQILKVDGTFPYFAPLYSKTDEVSQRVVVLGRGTERGGTIYYNNDPAQFRGWGYGSGLSIQRWGENVVAGAFANGQEWDLLAAGFDGNGLPSECQLSGGDSGGGTFINDGGDWKLAGINYAVDGNFYITDPATAFGAALIDVRGYHLNGGGDVPLTNPTPVPSSFYPTRISTKLSWIYSVTDPTGDLDGDGLPNLLEYGLHSDAMTPSANEIPKVGRAGSALTLTYRKVTTASDITYTVEKSSDLISWINAGAVEQILGTSANVQTVQASVDATGTTKLFLRLRITRP